MGKKILIADDEKNFAEVLRSELAEAGYEVILVRNGVEAVLTVIDRRVDMALLDIMMPGLDGINALRILRKLHPNLPVITFSGVAGSGEMAASLKAGAVKCLTKPFSMEQLISEIKNTLGE